MSEVAVPMKVGAATASDVQAIVPSPVIITEIQTGSVSGSDEFIELYNASTSAVDITGWQLRYSNASSAGDGTTLIASIASIASPGESVVLAAGAYFVLKTATVPVSTDVQTQSYTAKLSSADKTIGLFMPNDQTCRYEVIDAVAWGSASFGEGTPIPVAGASERLLIRKPTVDGAQYQDNNNNASDFIAKIAVKSESNPTVSRDATPGAITTVSFQGTDSQIGTVSSFAPITIDECELPADPDEHIDPPLEQPDTPAPAIIEPDDSDEELVSGPSMPARNTGLKAPQLVELLPNPAKPLTDASDEFIEIYNPNTADFELSGFILDTGKKKYIFPQGTLLKPQAFTAYFSSITRLSLANSQGAVQLLDPFGRTISEAKQYQSAKDGHAWILAQGSWQWTTLPTPNAINSLKLPIASKKKPSVKAVSTSGASAQKAQTSGQTTQQDILASTPTDSQTPPLHTGVLAIVAGFALLYGAYEYRHDVANKIHQFRSYRAARRAHRQEAEGR